MVSKQEAAAVRMGFGLLIGVLLGLVIAQATQAQDVDMDGELVAITEEMLPSTGKRSIDLQLVGCRLILSAAKDDDADVWYKVGSVSKSADYEAGVRVDDDAPEDELDWKAGLELADFTAVIIDIKSEHGEASYSLPAPPAGETIRLQLDCAHHRV